VKITTTSNFTFIQGAFIEAKRQALREERTGIVNPDRLLGVGLEGASRTGKSWDISVFICHYVTSYQGKQINICRDHLKKLKDTFYVTFRKVWTQYFNLPAGHFNKSATIIQFNGNEIRFVGVNDDVMTAHGLESDLLIINEAMGVDKESINQLEQRCNEFFIYDYNPSSIESHLYDLEKRPTYRLHKTTIFDNPYAPRNAKAKILSYAHPDIDDYDVAKKAGYSRKDWQAFKERNVLLGTAHKYNWEVYGLGKRAVGEDIIFQYQTYKEEPDENTLDWVHVGGDFGFKTDPTAMVRVKKQGNNLYLRELAYEEGRENVCFINVTYIMQPNILGEQKSKAAQLGIRTIMSLGLQPDVIVCRADNEVTKNVKEKISVVANVPVSHVISSSNVDSIYDLPLYYQSQGLDKTIMNLLNLNPKRDGEKQRDVQ